MDASPCADPGTMRSNVRRDVLAALAGAAIAGAVPLAWAQPKMRTLGYLSNGAGPEGLAKVLAAHGYVAGRNLRIEMRMTSNNDEELEANIRSLLQARPDVIVSWGGGNVTHLARATRSIPIVCGGTADPIGIGFAKTLRRPGGNITGLSYGVPEMSQILVGLMREVRPGLKRIANFVEGSKPESRAAWAMINRSIEEAARKEGLEWQQAAIATRQEFDRAVAPLDPRTSIAFVVNLPQPVTFADAAAEFIRRRMASACTDGPFVRQGAMMFYTLEHADHMARVAAIIDTLLRGADPAETPFQLPDRTTFIVNRRTARAIGLELPASVIARATEIVG
jgi:putative ABC transport system substrate-binding protein